MKEILAEKNAIKKEESSIESSAKPSALRVEEPIEPIEQNIESVDLSEIEEERRIEPSEKTSSFLESLKEIQEELIYEEDETEEDEEYNENEDPSFASSFDPDEF